MRESEPEMTELIDMLRRRKSDLKEMLAGDKCFDEQNHLGEGSDRTYWHYGYLVAINDILKTVDNGGQLQ